MDRDEAVRLLKDGGIGVREWNERRRSGEKTPALCKANLAGFDLESANLSWTNLNEADLGKACLCRAVLFKADLSRADLSEAKTCSCDLRGANLAGANLSGANLSRADLTQADLSVSLAVEADFSGARIRDVILPLEECSTIGQSILALGKAHGLEALHEDSKTFITDYVEMIFRYMHRPRIPEMESKALTPYFESALDRISVLRKLVSAEEAHPPELVEVVSRIKSELFGYLKSHPEEVYNIRPRQFEELIAEILASFGWEVRLTPETRDGGYDILGICKDISGVKSSWIIECKKYSKERKVGVDIVRALYGVRLEMQVGGALLATTSHFSEDAKAFKASRYGLNLLGYEEVLEWINTYRPNPNGRLYIKENRLTVEGLDE